MAAAFLALAETAQTTGTSESDHDQIEITGLKLAYTAAEAGGREDDDKDDDDRKGGDRRNLAADQAAGRNPGRGDDNGNRVTGQVDVRLDQPQPNPRVEVLVFDPDTCIDGNSSCAVFHQRFRLKAKQKGSIPFSLPKLQVTTYMVRASVFASNGSKSPLATADFRFGVRQNGMEDVPVYVLKGSTTAVDAADFEALVEKMAGTGKPVPLPFNSESTSRTDSLFRTDSPISVMVTKQSLVSDSVTIPRVKTMSAFTGELVDDAGQVVPGSSVSLLFVNGQLSVSIHSRGVRGDEPPEDLHLDPLSDYSAKAGRDQYVIYSQRNTVATPSVGPGLHVDPLPNPDSGTRLTPSAFDDNNSSESAARHANPTPYIIPVAVYEHPPVFPYSTEGHIRILNKAMAQFTAEFKDVARRDDPTQRVTVIQWELIGWRQISQNGYGDDCDANVLKFNSDYGDSNVVSVLFSSRGSNCGGIAPRPGRVALVSEGSDVQINVEPETYRAIALMQEIGHGFDYGNWDAHFSTEISESWFANGWDQFWNRLSCTAMRGGYDCTYPNVFFHHLSQRPLQTLAEGIARNMLPAAVPQRRPLPFDYAKDIAVGPDGSVWAIASNAGIWKKAQPAGTPDAANAWTRAASSPLVASAERIAVGSNGVPWVVTATGQIFRKATADPVDATYVLIPGSARDISIVSIFDDNVWIAGLSTPGLFKYDPSTNRFASRASVPALRLAADANGGVWFTHAAGGLVFFFSEETGATAIGGSGCDVAAGGPRRFSDGAPAVEVRVAVIGGGATCSGGQVYLTYQTRYDKQLVRPHWVRQVTVPFGTPNGPFGPAVGIAIDQSMELWEAVEIRLLTSSVPTIPANAYYTTNHN